MRARTTVLIAAFASLGAIWFVAPARSDGGTVTFTSAPSGPVEATGPEGTTVSYTATAVDSGGLPESIALSLIHI